MKLFKLTIISLILLTPIHKVIAQNTVQGDWCYTDQYMQEKYKQNPQLQLQNELLEEYILNNRGALKASMNSKKTISFIIPVVWHVITKDGQGNVTKADIDDQMLRLNEDFQRLNSDTSSTRALFAPYAADIEVEFRLAHLDPNGNCTEGIVRVESGLALNATDAVKGVSYWDSKKYFNIWTVITMAGDNPPSIILGYAQFPSSGINSTYGVVMRYNYIGRNQRTLTHELGHCFGLYHTFQSGCGFNCSTSGDRCCDTPPVTASTQGCDLTQNTCSNDASGPDPYNANVVDQIENYMSYDACQNMFSEDQKLRMFSYLNSTSTSTGLNQLTTPANLAFTGTDNPYTTPNCLPIADFSYDKEYICEGDAITFTDQSYNGTPVSWNWTFTGGTPATSPSQNPTITYNTAGIYDVTSQPSTAAGPGTITKTNIITVSSLTADYTGPFADSFENTTQFSNDWRIENLDAGSQTWANNTVASVTGNNSVRIRNYFVSTDGQKDQLISPSYDISTATVKTMTFKQAFAKKTSADTDRLLVYYSTNCGNSWLLKLPITSTTIATAPDHGTVFVPTSTEWVERTVDLSLIGNATNVRFMFEFESGGGNDIYIDDINIGGAPVNVDEFFGSIVNFNVFPNPTNSSAKIAFNLNKNIDNLSIRVLNSLGQEITNVVAGHSFSAGKYTLNIDEERKLSSGIYFVEL
jgi:PKD repeat protein